MPRGGTQAGKRGNVKNQGSKMEEGGAISKAENKRCEKESRERKGTEKHLTFSKIRRECREASGGCQWNRKRRKSLARKLS